MTVLCVVIDSNAILILQHVNLADVRWASFGAFLKRQALRKGSRVPSSTRQQSL